MGVSITEKIKQFKFSKNEKILTKFTFQGVEQEERTEILTSSHMLNMMYQIACGMVSFTF